MYKKLLLLSLSFLAFPLQATFYVGMSGGAGFQNNKQTNAVNIDYTLPQVDGGAGPGGAGPGAGGNGVGLGNGDTQPLHVSRHVTHGSNTNETSGLSFLTVGYQTSLEKQFFGAVEVFAGSGNFQKRGGNPKVAATIQRTGDPLHFRTQRQALFGAALRVGKTFPSLSSYYFKMGVQGEQVKQTFQDNFSRPGKEQVSRDIQPALLFGAGIQKSLGEKVFVRLEYTCSLGRSLTKTFPAKLPLPDRHPNVAGQAPVTQPIAPNNPGGQVAYTGPNNATMRLQSLATHAVTLGVFYQI